MLCKMAGLVSFANVKVVSPISNFALNTSGKLKLSVYLSNWSLVRNALQSIAKVNQSQLYLYENLVSAGCTFVNVCTLFADL